MRRLHRGTIPHVCTSCLYGVNRQYLTRAKALSTAASNSLNISYQPKHTSLKSDSLDNSSSHVLPINRVYSKRNKRTTTFSDNNGLLSKNQSIRNYASATHHSRAPDPNDDVVELDEHQMRQVAAIHKLKQRLSTGLNTLPKDQTLDLDGRGPSLEAVLTASSSGESPDDKQVVGAIKKGFGQQPAVKVRQLLGKVANHRNPAQRKVSDHETKSAMVSLGVINNGLPESASSATDHVVGPRRKRSLIQSLTAAQDARKAGTSRRPGQKATEPSRSQSEPSRKTPFETLDPRTLQLSPLDVAATGEVPQLSFDLSRVLFNPGVYQLQDPRSRVFNFDPYLAQPMPVSEFNFQGLNDYITSSKDDRLLGFALAHGKRYIGSSSSMSAVLCQLHFLISQWREINTVNLSRGFGEERSEFTQIQKCPAAIFLRWKNGIYAVDADKEYDEPNVLMSLGKSLEKLLTLEKDEFEKWRKTGTAADHEFADPQPESYHYATQGDFLLRSQLDARDPRLPGTGVFDLKTRAVAGIRMNMREHELGQGYQIKDRYGDWESFEREYYDMMRAAFLKYSMQVRMGNMDGIFVAYHNIQRLFGFQYIPISELDLALHGQSDRSLGDHEFRLSVDLVNQVFNKVTSAFPEQSVRFHFETRDATKEEPRPFMRVFAEPMNDQAVDEIQAKQDLEFAAYEQKLWTGQTSDSHVSSDPNAPPIVEDLKPTPSVSAGREEGSVNPSTQLRRSSDSTDADLGVLETVFKQVSPDVKAPAPRPMMGFKITISNKVNNIPVIRPEDVTAATNWTMDYRIEQLNDDVARKEYNYCKNRRMTALKSSVRDNHRFQNNIRELSRSGALWRQEQDTMDAQRRRVVLYQDRVA